MSKEEEMIDEEINKEDEEIQLILDDIEPLFHTFDKKSISIAICWLSRRLIEFYPDSKEYFFKNINEGIKAAEIDEAGSDNKSIH